MLKAALSAIAMLLASACTPSPKPLSPGDLAPSFRLQGSDGKLHDAAELRGKFVVIAWFPKAFTGGWTAECKSLRESGAALKAFDVAYFAASCDDPETNAKFAKELDLDYPILSDPDKTAAKAFGVLGPLGFPSRTTVYIDAAGKVAYVDRDVKTASHGKDIAAKLAELGAPKR